MRVSLPLAIVIAAGAASTVAAQPERPSGYLVPGEFDVTAVLEPAPRPGDPRYEADRDIFRDTRKLVGTPRYQLAQNDADVRPAAMLRTFSCAAGIALTPENAPRLLRVLQRATRDAGAQMGKAKDLFKRERPYVIDQGPTCQPPEALFDHANNRATYDYPSGHTIAGWTWALVLASVLPDRAQSLLQRGRAYGESRYICGVHNHSAVEAGMLAATATMALVQTKPAYQADLKAARSEIDRLRKRGEPTPTNCDAESALIMRPVLPATGPGTAP